MRYVLFLIILSTLACSLSAANKSTPVPGEANNNVSSDTIPPVVQIISPASGQQVAVGTDVEIRILATDNDTVFRIQLSANDRNAGSRGFPSDEENASVESILTWKPASAGNYELQVIAYDAANTPSSPAVITLQVVGGGETITNPAGGQTVVETAGDCVARVLIDNLRMRTGPGTNYERLGRFNLNEEVLVLGRNADTSWVKIRRSDSTEHWVINESQWIVLTGACSNLPVVN